MAEAAALRLPPRRSFLLRPSLWVFVITIIAYWDETALNGAFVYDDAGSVRNNVVVNGRVPWSEVWSRDYWGTLMSQPQSHKSFRPVTTLTFRLNWIVAERRQQRQRGRGDGGDDGGEDDPNRQATPAPQIGTFGFHLVNLLLHGVVSALVTEAAAFVFCGDTSNHLDVDVDVIARLIAGLIFGLHPVHVEAVTNITSRGELLMSLFFLLAFMIYATNLPVPDDYKSNAPFSFKTTVCIYIVPWLCMALSVFSKEQGATTLVTLIAYDFIHNHSSVKEFLRNAFVKRDSASIAFARRAVILVAQSAVVAGWRYWLNGETLPDFIYDQNPAGFAEDRFTRVFSVSWIYCLYIWDALYPVNLCPDWSGDSIDLIENWNDRRIVGVLALWTFAAACLHSLFLRVPHDGSKPFMETRRVVLMAFFAFTFSPFLLSSNLLVVVGLMKADRVIYLPLMGFALLEALLFKTVVFGPSYARDSSTSERETGMPSSRKYVAGYSLVMLQMALFTAKLHERNVAWSHSLNLWMSSYSINKRSRHTVYNCGYELSLKQRYAEAEQVLRPIGSPRVEGPGNTFVYAMVLYNLDRCEEALALIDDALIVVEEKKKTGGTRNTESSLARVRSNLLVAQAFCTDDMVEAGQTLYSAVQADFTNQYAIDQAMKMVKRVEASKRISELRARPGLS